MGAYFTSILVAFDGSETSYKAMDAAEELAKLSLAGLTVLYVHQPPTYPTPVATGLVGLNQPLTFAGPVPTPHVGGENEVTLDDDPSDTILSDAQLKLSSTLSHYVDFVKLTGNPAQEICDYANQHNFDLIVIGSRGLSGLKKLVMGSVSDQVTNHAECPVLVVK